MTECFHLDRRLFLRRAGRLAGGTTALLLLPGCGESQDQAADGSTPVARAPIVVVPAADISGETVALNFALNLAFVGAQFYGHATSGAGIADALLSGVGQQGGVASARKVAFADDGVARFAAEVAADKLAQVVSLRALLPRTAAAQPQIDFGAGATDAARAAGIVGASETFDAFADDDNFLIGAFFVEDVIAAAHRSLLLATLGSAGGQLVARHLAESIYHGGAVRALLAERAATSPHLTRCLSAACSSSAQIDGSDVGDQSLGADASSANLVDAAGNPIPFLRTRQQVLQHFYLSNGDRGGFLPNGLNAVQV